MPLRNKAIISGKLVSAGFLVLFFLTQCSLSRKAITRQEVEEKPGLPGSFELLCHSADTINSILISGAHTEYLVGDDRYEALVSVYACKDSLVYLSAVNSGFEILRALVDPDSIQVIDRVNRVVYRSPVRKKFGYQNPVDFNDIQNIVSRYMLCDKMDRVQDLSFDQQVFNFDQENIAKKIILDKDKNRMESFEFFHHQTMKYFMGERYEEGFKIYTNFMMGELEVRVRGGELSYNVEIPVKMNINRKRYSFVNL